MVIQSALHIKGIQIIIKKTCFLVIHKHKLMGTGPLRVKTAPGDILRSYEVTSRLDYCNALLAACPASSINKLQIDSG